jgi:threonine dehydratase
MSVTIQDVHDARRRLGSAIMYTPCPESIPLSELTGSHIYCKLEHLQRTGSFKERGARNALLLLDEERQKRGVIAASAGNHALGLSYHGKLLHIPVTVVMPQFAPLIKIANCQRMGARVILHGSTLMQAREKADEIAQREQLTYVHGFNDPAVIAGQGTLGLEIIEQVPDCQAIIVPVGGAGLIAGVALAVKSIRPDIKIVGVESDRSSGYRAAMAAGHPVAVECRPTLADGLAVGKVGDNSFALARQYVDRVIGVDESYLPVAILRLLEIEKLVVEGAAAAGLAAFLSGQLTDLAGQKVVLLLCGGNIDPITLTRVIEKGLAGDGRLCRFTATISDRPGGLADFAGRLSSIGASIKDITHDRAFSGADISAVQIICTVETNDHDHIRRLLSALRCFNPHLLPADV